MYSEDGARHTERIEQKMDQHDEDAKTIWTIAYWRQRIETMYPDILQSDTYSSYQLVPLKIVSTLCEAVFREALEQGCHEETKEWLQVQFDKKIRMVKKETYEQGRERGLKEATVFDDRAREQAFAEGVAHASKSSPIQKTA